MRSPAYRDFLIRAAEAKVLVNQAIASKSPETATALAKGAAILAAASLERYVNDFLAALCRTTAVENWADLSEGQKRYLAFQIAQRVRLVARRLGSNKKRDVGDTARGRLSDVLTEGAAAFLNPSSWNHHRSYGMFMDGAAEPERLDSVLRLFLTEEKGFFDVVAERGRDRGAMVIALKGLIGARHQVAHALVGPTVGPTDTRVWLHLIRVLVREIEAILWEARAASGDVAGCQPTLAANPVVT